MQLVVQLLPAGIAFDSKDAHQEPPTVLEFQRATAQEQPIY